MTYKALTQTTLTALLATTSPYSFKFNISKMHDIYRLPKNAEPTLHVGEDPVKRLDGFFKTLCAEVLEYNTRDPKTTEKPSIREKLIAYQGMTLSQYTAEEIEEARQEVLTDIADWFGDLTVYIRSEAMKFGLPLEDVLDAIMGSNFTKVKGGASGTPTYDANGKVLKDLSAFVPPEDAIKTILFGTAASTETPAPATPTARHPYERIGGEDYDAVI